MEQFGNWKVIARHSHGAGGLRVTVEHVRTGERRYHVIPLTLNNH